MCHSHTVFISISPWDLCNGINADGYTSTVFCSIDQAEYSGLTGKTELRHSCHSHHLWTEDVCADVSRRGNQTEKTGYVRLRLEELGPV